MVGSSGGLLAAAFAVVGGDGGPLGAQGKVGVEVQCCGRSYASLEVTRKKSLVHGRQRASRYCDGDDNNFAIAVTVASLQAGPFFTSHVALAVTRRELAVQDHRRALRCCDDAVLVRRHRLCRSTVDITEPGKRHETRPTGWLAWMCPIFVRSHKCLAQV